MYWRWLNEEKNRALCERRTDTEAGDPHSGQEFLALNFARVLSLVEHRCHIGPSHGLG